MKFKLYKTSGKYIPHFSKKPILSSAKDPFKGRSGFDEHAVEKATEFINFDEINDAVPKRKKNPFDKLANTLKNRLNKMKPVSAAFILRLWGMLLGTLLITSISFCAVVFSLFVRHAGGYTTINVPNLISLSASDAVKQYTDVFEYTIIYESNPDFGEGAVIAQSPTPNVKRRLYSGSEKIKLKLTVNKSPEAIVLPELVGKELRSSVLMLKNSGIKAKIVEEYSDTAPDGTIIFSSLPAGSKLKRGDTITLKVSLGVQPSYYLVPKLIGLSELEAASLIKSSGLTVGKIEYKASYMPAGTVVSQEPPYGNTLKEGSAVSFTVSGGPYYQ